MKGYVHDIGHTYLGLNMVNKEYIIYLSYVCTYISSIVRMYKHVSMDTTGLRSQYGHSWAKVPVRTQLG